MLTATRNKWYVFFVVLSVIITAFVGLRARHETLNLLNQTEETVDAFDGLMESDAYGVAVANELGVIVKWNQALEKITGWTASDMEGHKIVDCIPEMDVDMHGRSLRSRHSHAFTAALSNPEARQHLTVVDCSFPKKDGGRLPVRIGVRVVRGRHGNLYAIAHIDSSRTVVEKMAIAQTRTE